MFSLNLDNPLENKGTFLYLLSSVPFLGVRLVSHISRYDGHVVSLRFIIHEGRSCRVNVKKCPSVMLLDSAYLKSLVSSGVFHTKANDLTFTNKLSEVTQHIKTDKPMCGSRELEFAIFCIENVASKLHVDAQRVYAALTEQTDIMQEYIIPEYEVLHTQSKDHIVDDIIDVMRERDIKVLMQI